MNLARLILVSVTLMSSGCSDPENDRLEVGSSAVIAGKDGAYPGGVNRPVHLPPGIRVTIGHDDGFFQETDRDVERRMLGEKPDRIEEIRKEGPRHFEAGSTMAKYRPVSIVVETGEHKGTVCQVSRMDLRPVR